LHADGGRLPGVELLGLPQADRHPPHPDGGAGEVKPLDPRLLPLLRPATRPLTTVLVGNTVVALLVVGQAFAVAALVAGLLADPDDGWQSPAAWLVALSLLRYGAA